MHYNGRKVDLMDIQSMKSLLEIQALQSLGSSESTTNSLFSSGSSVFSDMIEELLTETATNLAAAENKLGSTSTLLGTTATTTIGASSDNPYLAAFMYAQGTVNPYSKLVATTETGNSAVETVTNSTLTNYNTGLAGASNYASIIKKAAATYDLPEKLLAAVMKQESNFNPNVISRAGATGLMQLMPATAKYLGVADSTDPEQNIMGGAKYLRQMLNQFDNNISTALAAYNAGPGNVRKYGGIPPFKETTNYVTKVMNYYQT